MAKDIMRFKNYSGKGVEHAIGLSLIYYMVSQDSSILLSNDKKVIVNQTWEEIKKILSNGGKVIFSLKKIRDYIETDLISNSHFGHILN